MQVTAQDLQFVAQFVHELCGVVLDDSKAYLVECRLADLAKQSGCSNYVELCNKARTESNRQIQAKIIDAITTHETLFFRDSAPFEAMQFKVVPELIDARMRAGGYKRLRIWSAACSTGQEPFSLAMTLSETLPDIRSWDIQILGSDISQAAVNQANTGRFSKYELDRGMKPQWLSKYFNPDGDYWRVKDNIRAMVSLECRNLLDPFSNLGQFDIIFCRNVAIYFNPKARIDLFNRLGNQLVTNGYLFVGSSETLIDLGARFQPHHHCRATFYMPNGCPYGNIAPVANTFNAFNAALPNQTPPAAKPAAFGAAPATASTYGSTPAKPASLPPATSSGWKISTTPATTQTTFGSQYTPPSIPQGGKPYSPTR